MPESRRRLLSAAETVILNDMDMRDVSLYPTPYGKSLIDSDLGFDILAMGDNHLVIGGGPSMAAAIQRSIMVDYLTDMIDAGILAPRRLT